MPTDFTPAADVRALLAAADYTAFKALLNITSVTGNAGTVTTIAGKISAGTNVTLSGAGTAGSPYVITSAASGSGTVTGTSVASANGFAGTVASATTTPVITITTSVTGLLKGNGTAVSAAVAGTDYVAPSGSITGNAGTATILQTTRTINGVNFNGSANITVTAAAATLTGNTLASGVLNSSLTSVGIINTGVWQGTIIGPTFLGTGSSIGTKFLRGDGTWQTVDGGGGGGGPSIDSYLGPVELTPASGAAAWDFSDGSQASLVQDGALVVTLSNVPNGHSGSLSVVVGTAGTVSLAMAGMSVLPVDNYSALDPEALPPGSWYELSFKRVGTILRLWFSKRTAQPIPNTITTPEIGFNGGNLPYVSIEPVWEAAAESGWRWYINEVHDATADDDVTYTSGGLVDLDVIRVTFWASNPDNSAEIESNEITYDSTPPEPIGLLNDLLEWWEDASDTGIHAGTVASGTPSSTIAGPNGLDAWGTTIVGTATITPPIEIQAVTASSPATFAWAGRINGSVNNNTAFAQLGNDNIGGYIGIVWEGADGKIPQLINGYSTLKFPGSTTYGQYFSFVVVMNGNSWNAYIDGILVGNVTDVYGVGAMNLLGIYGSGPGEVEHLVVAVANRAWDEDDIAAFHNEGNFRTYASL